MRCWTSFCLNSKDSPCSDGGTQVSGGRVQQEKHTWARECTAKKGTHLDICARLYRPATYHASAALMLLCMQSPSQMYAKYSLKYLAPIVAHTLCMEDAEAGREKRYVLDDGGEEPDTAAAQAAAGASAGSVSHVNARAGASSRATTSAVAPPGRWVPKRIEDVQGQKMKKDLVQCDMCKTTIANLHR